MLIAPIRRQDAERALVRALAPLLAPATLLSSASTPWSSMLYSGTRLALCYALAEPGAAGRADRLARELPEHEFTLRNHVVIDLLAAVGQGAGGEVLLTIDSVTIEDA